MRTNRDNKNFNPFPGLRPFAPEESDLFFGREGESDEVLGKLLKNRFVTVIGASGSGKSSLMYCGLVPILSDQGMILSEIWLMQYQIIFQPPDRIRLIEALSFQNFMIIPEVLLL